MLKVAAPYPQVGSFALLVDRNLPTTQQRVELVRIQMRHAGRLAGQQLAETEHISVAFPLRIGASGNRIVSFGELIDATPLTPDEEAELRDLRAYLSARVRPNRAKIERAEAMRTRQVYSEILKYELATLARRDARDQPSVGRHLPREAA